MFGLLVAVHGGSGSSRDGGGRPSRTVGPLLALEVHAVVMVALVGFLWVLDLFTQDFVRDQVAPWAVWPTCR